MLKPYPEYKDSGLPWLREIPKHWDIGPGLSVFREKQLKNTGMVETTVLSLSYGRIVVKPPDKLHGLVPASFETYQIVDPGEIVIRPTDLQNDKTSLRVGIARGRGIITSAYLCLRTIGPMIPEYGFLLLHTYDVKKIFYGMGSGLRQNIDFRDLKRIPVVIPSREEQSAIASYLAHADRRINRLIRAKRRLIELLNEQKQAIIQQAVTRGLDPNVRLKPSGSGWLGDVPEHWEIQKLRHIAQLIVSNVDKHTIEGEMSVRLCNYTDVYKNEFISSDLGFMAASATADEIKKFRIRLGDVLITKDSELWNDIGVPSFVSFEAPDLVCGYHLAILRPTTERIHGEFLHRALQDRMIATQLHVAANGVTRFGLSQQSIKDVLLPIPPSDEQLAIAERLAERLRSTSASILRAGRESDLLREYRTRMIADVVTGKLDVRGVELPTFDETEALEAIDTAEEVEADEVTDTEGVADGDE